MNRRKVTYGIGFLAFSAAIFFWQLPALLRTLPSRYVALMPEPVQAMGVREHVQLLPTAAVDIDLSDIRPASTTAVETPAPLLAPVLVVTEVGSENDVETVTTSAEPTAPPTPTLLPTPLPVSFSASARLNGVRHQFQAWNNCGPATLAMGLSYFDLYLLQSTTADWLKPNPEDRNVSPYEMVSYVRQNTQLGAIDRANGDLDLIRQFLSNDIPVIIETGIDPPGEFSWMEWYGHYYLVIAYSDEQQQLWVYDSWLGSGIDENSQPIVNQQGKPISYKAFDRYWRHFNREYIAIYQPNQEPLVNEIIGAQLEDRVMWEASLTRNLDELDTEPENAYLWFNVGTAYNGLEQFDKAAKAFDQARMLGLPWRMLWYQFGPYEAYLQTGRYQDVIDLADVTLNQRPYFEESYFYRGMAFKALGDSKRAVQDLRRAAEFNPKFKRAVEALEAFSG